VRRARRGYNAARMPTPAESAELILKLFELRRDPLLREARAWFVREFNPATVEELAVLASGPKNPWIRMVVGYWDMAASLVVHGAIDRDMFLASNSEMLSTFAKLEPFLGPLRDDTPGFVEHMEAVLRPIPNVSERMASLREQFRAIARAETGPSGGVRVVARLKARPGQTAAVGKILEALVPPSRREAGCVTYELLHNSSDPTDFTFIEEWADDASLDAHGASGHVAEASAKLAALLAGPADIQRYRVVA
jgi:quinol monooxygenase YgiN